MESHLTPMPLDREAFRRAVADPGAGAVLLFEGTVRDHSEGRAGVIALEYEAHATMADRVIAEVVEEARSGIPVRRVAVCHRLGRVELGEPTVIIAVSAAHRDEAYRASRRIIDGIKHRAPIWKREIRADGTSEWSKGCTAHAVGEVKMENEK